MRDDEGGSHGDEVADAANDDAFLPHEIRRFDAEHGRGRERRLSVLARR